MSSFKYNYLAEGGFGELMDKGKAAIDKNISNGKNEFRTFAATFMEEIITLEAELKALRANLKKAKSDNAEFNKE